jgi:hypothetical protein
MPDLGTGNRRKSSAIDQVEDISGKIWHSTWIMTGKFVFLDRKI